MKKGYTLIEAVCACALFGIVSLVGLLCFLQAIRTWRNSSSRDRAGADLRRASLRLQSDLLQTSFSESRSQQARSSLGGGPDGDALWFLSAHNGDGTFVRCSDGEPFWQRNVLYYASVPSGPAVGGVAGADGYEDRCPNKVLIRKVIDFGVTTLASDESTIEPLLTNPNPYLTRPAGLSTQAMLSEPGVVQVEILCRDLLRFTVQSDQGQWNFDLRAVRLEEARRHLALGSISLAEHVYTLPIRFGVRPHN